MTDIIEDSLDALGSDYAANLSDPYAFLDTELDTVSTSVTLQPGEIDPRIKRLSYSSTTKLHSCPRRYQLYKLETSQQYSESVHTTYGSCLGMGIQLTLQGYTEAECVIQMFAAWNIDLFSEISRKKKSFWYAVSAMKAFRAMYPVSLLQHYEIASFGGKQAVELSFRLDIGDGFSYIGYIDAVLRHRETGQLLILELKTTGNSVPAIAEYKNSAQALGYSIILHCLTGNDVDYDVLYLVYSTSSAEYTFMPFTKTPAGRVIWLKELLIDKESILRYESFDHYPMHGESCYSFFSECEYFNRCTMSTCNLGKPLTEKHLERIEAEEYDVNVSLDEVIEMLTEQVSAAAYVEDGL